MPDLERVLKAIEQRKNPPRDVGAERDAELLEEVRLVGTAVELQEHYRNLAKITHGLVDRIDKMEVSLNTKVDGLPKPPALDGLQSALENLTKELTDAFPMLAREIKTAQESYKNIQFPEFPEIPRTDLTPIHEDVDSLYQALSQMTVPQAVVKEVVAQQPARNWTFDVKRNNQGFIKSVDVKER